MMYTAGATVPRERTGAGGMPDLPDRHVQNKNRRAAVRLVHAAWKRARTAEVSSQLFRIMDYLMTPEGLVEFSETANWHRENREAAA